MWWICDESVKNERPVDRIGPTAKRKREKKKEREKEREKKRRREEKSVYHEQVDIYVRYWQKSDQIFFWW